MDQTAGDQFARIAREAGLRVSEAQLMRLRAGAGWLASASSVSGLSQYTSEADALLRAMAPAVAYFRAVHCPKAGRMADLGCGNGAIGGTIAFFAPNLSVDLVDRAKRAYTTSELLITKLRVQNARAVQIALERLDQVYDVAVFRALAPADEALPLAAKVVRPGGCICAYHRCGDAGFVERPSTGLVVLETLDTVVPELVLTCYRR